MQVSAITQTSNIIIIKRYIFELMGEKGKKSETLYINRNIIVVKI